MNSTTIRMSIKEKYYNTTQIDNGLIELQNNAHILKKAPQIGAI